MRRIAELEEDLLMGLNEDGESVREPFTLLIQLLRELHENPNSM